MIEQTELVVTTWKMHPAANEMKIENLSNHTSLDVQKKRAPTKKGIACRLSCTFLNGDEPVLDYVAEHSYVIDLDEVIDKNELMKMIRNSYSMFTEKFDFRKLGTVLHNEYLKQIDEEIVDVDAILPLLV